MIVDVSKKILIVGLGLLGGSYARVLKRFGFHISAITLEQSSIDYALGEGIIDEGATTPDARLIGEADLVIFALYPHVFVEWLSYGVLTPIDFYALPYRCFYSKDIANMFMAGRNISVTHIALGSTRVMRTCGLIGEVVGMAAAVCSRNNAMPRDEIGRAHV